MKWALVAWTLAACTATPSVDGDTDAGRAGMDAATRDVDAAGTDASAPLDATPSDGALGVDGPPSDPDAAIGDAGTRDGGGAGWEPPDPITVERPLEPDYSELPRDPEGRPILRESRTTRTTVRTERRPADALVRCAHLVTSCFGAGRSVDQCVLSAPRCTTAQPWNEPYCCPAECADTYAAERRAGALATEALDRTFFTAPGCVPGATEILELMERY